MADLTDDPDAPSLMEWLDLVDATDEQRGWEDLADGEVLLRIMHDLDPNVFPSPDERHGRPGYCPTSEYVTRLLEGLEVSLQGRGGAGDGLCSRMLQLAREGRPVDPVTLTKLVLVATVENELPRRTHYIEKLLSLSVGAQEAVRFIVERFQTGAGFEVSGGDASVRHSAPKLVARDSGFGLAFTPPSRSATARDVAKFLPDFMEVGLDAETRFRRLKEQYVAAMDELERLTEERDALRPELEAEKAKRKDAEEAERVARMELRLGEEARERMKDEQRSLFDLRLEQEVGRYKEKLKERQYELDTLREEASVMETRAAASDKLAHQLEVVKQRLEEQQALKRQNDDLRKQLEDLSTRPGSGAGEHLHRSLVRAREDALVASKERDEANRQSELLREELAREQAAGRKATEDLAALRKQFGLPDTLSPTEGGGATGSQALAVEAGVAMLTEARVAGEAGASSKPSRAAEELKLLSAQKDDLLERLLGEKERATRAETNLQAKVAEAASLAEQKAKLEAQVQTLQKQLVAAPAQPSAPSPGGDASAPASDGAEVKELQRVLALRERELQVLQWRGQSESQAMAAQERFTASCFHEVGLRYQKLLVQNEALMRRVKEGSSAG